jgi:hypothetical protein
MPSNTMAYLKGIGGTSPQNVYAVGDDGTLLHYDGKLWMAVPNPLSEDVDLQGTWGRADSDMAVLGDDGAVLRGLP